MNRFKVFLILVALLTSSVSMSQSKKVALGLSLNPTLNWFAAKSSQLESDGNRLGFNYGLVADFNFGENYAYSTGLFINNAGGKLKSVYTQDSINVTQELNVKIQSIRMPITLRMMTKEIGYFRYYGVFGFNFDYVINANADVRVNGGPEQSDVDIKKDMTPIDLSLSLGIGVLYNLSGTTNFIMGLSFNNGFVDAFKGDSDNGEPLKANTNQIALNLGILF